MIAPQALRLHHQFNTSEDLNPSITPQERPTAQENEAVIEIYAAAINPSDVKAALGQMPHAIWPRTPGRDFSGRVIDGPTEWLGVDVWGTGGDLGITRNGTHARYLVLPTTALSRKPNTVALAAAATVGVPFITAYEGLRRAHLTGKGQTVLVLGANGKVGQATTQLATRAGAHVITVDRSNQTYQGHATGTITSFSSQQENVTQAILDATHGKGVDIAYNTVGSPYFQLALNTLAIGGTQVLISTIERNIPFDILAFYRRNLHMLGVDSLKLNVVQCAAILNDLASGFDDGTLQAFDVNEHDLIALTEAADAYRRVLNGSNERIVLTP